MTPNVAGPGVQRRFLASTGSRTLKLKANVLDDGDEHEHGRRHAACGGRSASASRVPARMPRPDLGALGRGRSSLARIASRPASTARKLTALNAKQKPAPASATTTPPSAGPTIRAPLNRLELSATAFGSSRGPTIRYVSACRDGASSTSTVPRSPASR